MRTTLNIDEDVLLAVRDRARREKRSSGAVISELARDALTGGQAAATGAGGDEARRHGFRPLPHRGPAVSNALVDRLREEEPA